MLFLLRGRKLNACRCCAIVINKVKSFKHSPPQLLNPNARFPLLCYELSSSKTTLSAADPNVKRYLNYLMDAYRDQCQKSESVAEILNIRTVSMLLNEKRKITENIKSLSDLGKSEECLSEVGAFSIVSVHGTNKLVFSRRQWRNGKAYKGRGINVRAKVNPDR